MTTVKKLIEMLQEFPPDAHVSYRAASIDIPLDLADVTLARAEEKGVIFRNGFYMDIDEAWGDGSEKDQFVTVVRFPGN